MSHALHFDAHAAGTAGDGAHGSFEIGRREIRCLRLCDRLDLVAGELADLVLRVWDWPLLIFAALRMSTDAGGVFITNVKLLSW